MVYCIVLPFSKFTESYLDLSYLHTLGNVKKRDIYILNSQKIYHTINNKDSNRQSLVFTNYNFVIKHFCTLNVLNLFSKFNKINKN